MTYDDVLRHEADKHLRRPPWHDEPGHFMAKLIPSGIVDPLILEAPGMSAAIGLARHMWEREAAPGVRLFVTRNDGSESFMGPL